MYKLWMVLLLLWYVGAKAQTVTHQQPGPDYYLDSVQVNFSKIFIDPSNIKSIDVQKDAPRATNGAVYITLKGPHIQLISLAELSRKYQLEASIQKGKVAYIIANEFIQDTAGVRIDTSFVKKLNLLKLNQAQYIAPGLATLSLLMIQLGKKEEPGQIRLR